MCRGELWYNVPHADAERIRGLAGVAGEVLPGGRGGHQVPQVACSGGEPRRARAERGGVPQGATKGDARHSVALQGGVVRARAEAQGSRHAVRGEGVSSEGGSEGREGALRGVSRSDNIRDGARLHARVVARVLPEGSALAPRGAFGAVRRPRGDDGCDRGVRTHRARDCRAHRAVRGEVHRNHETWDFRRFKSSRVQGFKGSGGQGSEGHLSAGMGAR